MSELDRVRALIPDVNCKGLCTDCCGPVPHSEEEHDRMAQTLTVNFMLTCSALDGVGRCSVYEERPLLCRLWGAVEKMTCQFGCVPADGWLDPDVEAEVLAYYEGQSLIAPEQTSRIALPGLHGGDYAETATPPPLHIEGVRGKREKRGKSAVHEDSEPR